MNTYEPDSAGALRPVLRGRFTALLRVLVAFATVQVAFVPLRSVAAPPDAGGKRSVSVMTANLYIGGGTERITALDPTVPNFFANLIAEVTGVYYEILGSKPAIRMQRVADEIAARKPDIVSLEEVSTIRIQSPGDILTGGTTPATDVVYDYQQLVLAALAARGARYTVAATSTEWDVEMPMLNLQTGDYADARQTDHEIILVRSDLPPGQLRVSNPQSGHFTNVLQFPLLGLAVTRGWCSVDVFIRGQSFRFISTHLEQETSALLQVLQVGELLAGPANTRLPVILVGDFNTDPLHRDGSVAYDLLPAAGFTDAWLSVHSTAPTAGLTWGHDEFLANPAVPFDRRIDFVFFRGAGFAALSADVTDLNLARTSPPLWATDHAALSAELAIDRAPFARGD